jgi:spore coat protein U domain-containing protein, fimbrial subunit CupE1/2/3/6
VIQDNGGVPAIGIVLDRVPRQRSAARGFAVASFLIALFPVLGTLAEAGPSPQTATSTVAATVLGNCRVGGASGPLGWTVNFGTYQLSLATAVNFDAVLYCTKGTVVSGVTLDNGSHFAQSSRSLSDGLGHLLPYALYTSDCSSAATPWSGSNTPAAFQTVTSTGVRTPIGGTDCAKIAAGINVPSGAYNDTVTITVTFT